MNHTVDKSIATESARLIFELYDLIDIWRDEGKPSEREFEWDDEKFRFDRVGGLSWAESMVYRRRPGPRNRYRILKEMSPMAAVGVKAQTLFIAIRGTSLPREWDTNLRFHSRPIAINGQDFGYAHDGFTDTYESMIGDIDGDIDACQGTNNVDHVVVCGHSLGAAVATLVFADLSTSSIFSASKPSFSCYLYGAPRVGDDRFKSAVESDDRQIIRFENIDDPVICVPPEQVGPFRFSHAGNAVELNADMGNPASNHLMPAYLAGVLTFRANVV